MHPLLRRAFGIPRKPERDEGKALDEVLHQVYWGQDRTPQEARRAIDEGLVPLFGCADYIPALSSRWNRCCGVLLTRNGYALMTLHGLERNRRNQLAVTGEKLDVSICAINRHLDIALVKAEINGPPEAIPYKFHEPWTTKEHVAVTLIARNDTQMERYGFLIAAHSFAKGTGERQDLCYMTNAKSEHGFSGGVNVLEDGSIIGIHTRGGKEFGTTGTKIGACLSLVATYRAHLAKKYGI